MKKKVSILISIILFFGVTLCYSAFKIPSSPTNYVNDYAGVLKSSQEQSLNKLLKNYELKTTNQLFIATFKSLNGENLEDLSIRIAERWKPGIKDKDNGVLLLIFIEDRKMRIEVGYGLEHTLTDALSQAVIINEIRPEFIKGDYYSGINKGTIQIIKILSGQISKEDLGRYSEKTTVKKGNGIFSLIILIIMIIFFIRHPFLALLLFSGGFSSGGRYGGGGSFGGGGGSFGGGGASGGW